MIQNLYLSNVSAQEKEFVAEISIHKRTKMFADDSSGSHNM